MPRTVTPTAANASQVRECIDAPEGLTRLRAESCRDEHTILRIAARQPVYGASLRAVMAACERMAGRHDTVPSEAGPTNQESAAA